VKVRALSFSGGMLKLGLVIHTRSKLLHVVVWVLAHNLKKTQLLLLPPERQVPIASARNANLHLRVVVIVGVELEFDLEVAHTVPPGRLSRRSARVHVEGTLLAKLLSSDARDPGIAAMPGQVWCCDDQMTGFVPMWKQVQDDILRRIEAGLLKPGDQLPSTTAMADQYDTSPGTVRKAVDILIAMGVLRGHQGLGVFVAGSKDDS